MYYLIYLQYEAGSETWCFSFFGKFSNLFNPWTVPIFHSAEEAGPESDDEEEEDDNDVSPALNIIR